MSEDTFEQKKEIERVSSWYKTEGFYTKLVKFGYESIKDYFFGENLLEVGPADGVMTEFLLRDFKEIECVEPSEKYARLLRKKFPKITVHNCLIEDFFPIRTYDTILFAHVIEHLSKPVTVLKNIKKFMSKNSVLIIIVPNANSLHRQVGKSMGIINKMDEIHELDKRLGHKRVYAQELLKSHVQRSGLKIKKEGGIFLKPLSNEQLKSWDQKIVEALFEVGKDYPSLCAEIYVACKK